MAEPQGERDRSSLYERVLSAGPILFDGEVGGGIRKRVAQEDSTKLTPASVLLDSPNVVRDLHLEYIAAGARVITTNTYATVRERVEQLLGKGDKWEEMVTTAVRVAEDAVKQSGQDVLIAGCLPPLHGSYKPEEVGNIDDIIPVYREHVALMQGHVDFFLCETMSTAQEGRAAASAAKSSGKPVWVSWNIADDASSLLRSGETLQEAWDAIADLKVDGVLVNCCAPECVSAALPYLRSMGTRVFGGYGNAFSNIPLGWRVENGGIAALGVRRDLTCDVYRDLVKSQLDQGANVVGGCCEVGVDHIASLRKLIDGRKPISPAPVCLVVDLEIQVDRVDEFIKAMTVDLEGSRTEPGCFRFDLLRDPDVPTKFTLFEVYKDEEAVAYHREQPHFKTWSAFEQSGGCTKLTVNKSIGYNYRA